MKRVRTETVLAENKVGSMLHHFVAKLEFFFLADFVFLNFLKDISICIRKGDFCREERLREKDFPFTGSFPKWLGQTELDRSEAI